MRTCISDLELTSHIKSAINQNSHLADKKIDIEVEQGWVVLEGKVAREEDRRLAQACVEDILGVYGVTNNLTFSRTYSHQTS